MKLIFILFLSFSCSSQTVKDSLIKKKFKLNPWENVNGFRASVGYLEDFELEGAYILSSFPKQDPGFGGFAMLVQYISGGIEYVRIGKVNAVGPKLSYEVNFSIFSGQIGIDYLFSDKSTQMRLLPKLGLSVFGIITVYYGWNKNLLKQNELITSQHVITLQLNILDY
ncbi:MAG: hypothetical protein Q8K02_15600 [Flavobacterium sp.]|nr:hypothetical protein [Flavobacterium sp.]